MANETQATKWTPGPWRVAYTGEPEIKDQYRTVIASVEDMGATDGQPTHPTTEANAHLIAAAPELYEALDAAESQLQSLMNQLLDWAFNGAPDDGGAEMNDLAHTVNERCVPHRAVLAKARGVQPSD